jgi:hypothetical protein
MRTPNRISFRGAHVNQIQFSLGAYWDFIAAKADGIICVWLALDAGLDENNWNLALSYQEASEMYVSLFGSRPPERSFEARVIQTVMWHFYRIAECGENLPCIWKDSDAEARQDIDGSDEEPLEWASKYSVLRPHLFKGSLDDVEVIRIALRSFADELLDKVLRHLATTLPPSRTCQWLEAAERARAA